MNQQWNFFPLCFLFFIIRRVSIREPMNLQNTNVFVLFCIYTAYCCRLHKVLFGAGGGLVLCGGQMFVTKRLFIKLPEPVSTTANITTLTEEGLHQSIAVHQQSPNSRADITTCYEHMQSALMWFWTTFNQQQWLCFEEPVNTHVSNINTRCVMSVMSSVSV